VEKDKKSISYFASLWHTRVRIYWFNLGYDALGIGLLV